ncbi:MAG: hypothetical protein U0271_23815 [Polyangiaceae bacterium]
MSPFSVCEPCGRHIRVTELACPFCGAAQPERTAAPTELRVPFAKRAAVFLAASMTVAGCSSGEVKKDSGSASARTPAASSSSSAATQSSAKPTATVEVTSPAARYGLPPHLEADELI